MQLRSIKTLCGLLAAVLLATSLSLVAAEPEKTAEEVSLKDGKLTFVEGGNVLPLDENVVLPNDIKVSTKGTFTVNGGKERKLKEGQVLDKNGMLTSADGSVVPVVDHITRLKGQLMLVKDGEATVVDHDITFPDGSKVTPDSTFYAPNGALRRILDGDLFKLNGKPIPTRDTISLQGKTVVVQKDGSLIRLRPEQSIMMNDGTKALGNGTVITPDGDTITLTDGQIMEVAGVVAPKK